ncbi:hypothetical protein L227DRAFT_616027, partial [Lentinus tigrinus ALCF2SS1-6]
MAPRKTAVTRTSSTKAAVSSAGEVTPPSKKVTTQTRGVKATPAKATPAKVTAAQSCKASAKAPTKGATATGFTYHRQSCSCCDCSGQSFSQESHQVSIEEQTAETLREDSDDALDEDASPTKKSRTVPCEDDPASEDEPASEDVDMSEDVPAKGGRKVTRTPSAAASTKPKKTVPLPRCQTVKAQAAAKAKATATEKKGAAKARGPRKVNPPDAGERFFNPAEDESTRRSNVFLRARLTRLFTRHTSTVDIEDEDDVEGIRYTMEGIKIKQEPVTEVGEKPLKTLTLEKSKEVRFHSDDEMEVDSKPSNVNSIPSQYSDQHLDDLLNGNVVHKGNDSSGVLDYDTPEALDPSYALPIVICLTLSPAIEDAYRICRRSLLRVILYAGGEGDNPFVINPARYDPSKAVPYVFMSSKPRVLCCKGSGAGTVPHRFICVDVVVVIDCHVVNSTHLYRDPSKVVKQLIASPLRGEHERAAGFFGT